MEILGEDHRIRVKNKFVDHVKLLTESDPVLSSVSQLTRIEDHVAETEPFTYFGVKFNDESPSKYTISEIQVRILHFPTVLQLRMYIVF